MVVIDRLPDWLRRAGLAAFDRREIDIPVAHLELDTLMSRAATPRAPRLLKFTTADHTVMVSVTTKPRSVALAIAVTPPAAVDIDVRPLRGNIRHVHANDRGTAACDSIARGPLSLLVHWPPEAGGAVRTSWTQV